MTGNFVSINKLNTTFVSVKIHYGSWIPPALPTMIKTNNINHYS